MIRGPLRRERIHLLEFPLCFREVLPVPRPASRTRGSVLPATLPWSRASAAVQPSSEYGGVCSEIAGLYRSVGSRAPYDFNSVVC